MHICLYRSLPGAALRMQQRLTGDTLRLCRATLAAAKYDVATREMFAAVQGCMLAVVLLLSCFRRAFLHLCIDIDAFARSCPCLL